LTSGSCRDHGSSKKLLNSHKKSVKVISVHIINDILPEKSVGGH